MADWWRTKPRFTYLVVVAWARSGLQGGLARVLPAIAFRGRGDGR